MLTVLVIGGVWGSIVLAGLFKGRTNKLLPPTDDPRIDQLEEDHLRLEAQVARLEEEVSFFRELQKPAIPTQLRGSERADSEPKA